MILIDTSIWIDLLNGRVAGPDPDQILSVATCGPIMQEVFQGLREGRDSESFRESFRALPFLSDPVPQSIFAEAGEIYRDGRRRGLTIRSSVDCQIAAIAIAHGAVVWHRDRDFTAIARFTKLLQTTSWPFGR